MSKLARDIAPAHRTTQQLRASLHERLAGTRGVHELADLERRIADLLEANERGEMSAADVVGSLYEQGYGRPA